MMIVTLNKKLMKTSIVREYQVFDFGFTRSQCTNSCLVMRSLNADKGSTPNVRIRRSRAGMVLFTWSFSVDLNNISKISNDTNECCMNSNVMHINSQSSNKGQTN